MFSCEFSKISKNTFFTEHLWTTASGLTECHYRKSSIEIYKLTKVPSIFNEESVGWNLNKQMLLSL